VGKRTSPRLLVLATALVGLAITALAAPAAISSEAELDQVIKNLHQPVTRLQAFLDLVGFAGCPNWVTSKSDDPRLRRMQSRALEAMVDCPDIDHVISTMIKRLDDPRYRLEMIGALLRFAGPDLRDGSVVFVTAHPELNALMDRARDAANQAADVKTVTAALASPDRALRKWGISRFGNRLAPTQDWAPLLPQIEELAAGDDPEIRSAAIGPLAHFPGTEGFLDRRFAVENSAFLLMGLLHSRDIWGAQFNARFLPRFVQLLDALDEAVRDEALNFIGCSGIWAEMYKVPFGRDVFDKVLEATRSRSAKERFLAVFALCELRHIDPEASRKAFLRLVNDPAEDVRWRLGFGLVDQQGREDVKQAIAKLVNDQSPLVRYMTILAAGPKKYIPQMQELTQSTNTQIAKWATDEIKGLSNQAKDQANGVHPH
jgi:hypothetical protein